MIRNIIKATLFIAVVVSVSSVIQVTMALDLSLEGFSSTDPYHPFAWTPDVVEQQNSQDFSSMLKPSRKQDLGSSKTIQRKLSLEVYQGDGLDALRQNPGKYNIDFLPEEDAEAYGVSVKQRF